MKSTKYVCPSCQKAFDSYTSLCCHINNNHKQNKSELIRQAQKEFEMMPASTTDTTHIHHTSSSVTKSKYTQIITPRGTFPHSLSARSVSSVTNSAKQPNTTGKKTKTVEVIKEDYCKRYELQKIELTKEQKANIRRRVKEIIENSNLTASIKQLIHNWANQLSEISINKERKKALAKIGFAEDTDAVIELCNEINAFLKEKKYKSVLVQHRVLRRKETPVVKKEERIIQLSKAEQKIAYSYICDFLKLRHAEHKIPTIVYEETLSLFYGRDIKIDIDNDDYWKSDDFETRSKKGMIRICNQIIEDVKDRKPINVRTYRIGTNASPIQPKPDRVLKPQKEADEHKQHHFDQTQYIRKGKLPRFGYARDYFGRVQECDSYREDREVNPYHSRSDYDKEDDHESMDSLD